MRHASAMRTSRRRRQRPAVAARRTSRTVSPGDERFVRAARRACRLSRGVQGALADLVEASPPVRGAAAARAARGRSAVGHPPHPAAASPRTARARMALLAVACRLGEPVGYEPEHGGDLVQDIVPVATALDRQVSSRPSRVELMFHTEAAVPSVPAALPAAAVPAYRPTAAATTTTASIHEVLALLPADVVDLRCSPAASARPWTRATSTAGATCSAPRWRSSAVGATGRRWSSTPT